MEQGHHGCCCRDAIRLLQTRWDLQRERRLYHIRRAKDAKILLLGCDSSGKSTFMRQLRIMEEGGLPEEERKTYKPTICQNIITSAQTLIQGMQFYDIQYMSKEVEECAKMILDLEVRNVTELNANLLAAVKKLWRDAGVQTCYKHRDDLYLLESTKYFMKKLDEVSAVDYIPTEQDVLRSRSPTTGVSEYRLPIEGQEKKLCIVNVGGHQRSERPKWVHCFERCITFIFMSAISEFNQLNEHGENRMKESLALFKDLLGSSALRYTSTVVFLNKVDIFHEKIKKHHLRHYFRDYKGPKKNPEAAEKFFVDKFHRWCYDARRVVYVHGTCATDTENISPVFSTVRDYITKLTINQYGLT